MSIAKLNQNQINVVAGGKRGNVFQEMHHIIDTFLEEHHVFKDAPIGTCVSAIAIKYGVTLCLPTIKPLACPYETWGNVT